MRMAGFQDRGTDLIEMPVVPHPAVTLVLDFGTGALVVDDGGGAREPGGLVAGLLPGPVRLRGRNLTCVEVRLSPLAARRVLGEWDRTVISLEDVWGREASRLREQLAESSSWGERFALTEAQLARRGAAGRVVDPEVARVWSRILGTRGRARIDDLAVEVGWSRRRLWGRFRDQMGLPPKQAAKLVRFDHAAGRLVAGEAAADVATVCGFVDQAHLHRDVQAFTGMTPVMLATDLGLAVDHSAYT
ncbi:helix-turn-helix domain-containing protein [Nocardia heshunensis]